MIEGLALLLGAFSGLVGLVAGEFSKTSHGPNPWSLDALANAIRVAPHVYRAIGLLGGKLNDMFRSPAVNAAVGGVGDSYHQHGLAVDIGPNLSTFGTVEAAFRAAARAALAGELGAVRTVIWEPTWVHLDWFKEGELKRTPNFFKKTGPDKYEKVAV